MIPSFTISDASFNEDGDVQLTFEGLNVINMADVQLIESLPRMLQALKAAYFYINSSPEELEKKNKIRDDYLYEFHMYCPDLSKLR